MLYDLEERQILHETDAGWRLALLLHSDDLSASVPNLIRQAIDSRLGQLGTTTRRLLEIAAVIGQDVPLDLWRQLTDVDDQEFFDATRRAIDGHFILESSDGRHVYFSHALVRDVLYSNVVLPERQLLHRRVGEALVSVATPDPEQTAHHFARAGDPRAIDWLLQAGEQALEVYAAQTAIGHFNRASELAQAFSSEPPPSMFRPRGHANAMVGEFDKARDDFTTALESARSHGDNVAEWHALEDLGMLWAERDYAMARQYFDEALGLARSIGDEALIAHSLNRAGNWLVNVERPLEAISYHAEALAIFQCLGDARAVAQTTDLLGLAHFVSGDLVTGCRFLRSASDGFAALGDRIGLCSSLATLIMTAGANGSDDNIPGRIEPTELENITARAVALARETRWRAGEAYACNVIAAHHGARGQYEPALDYGQRSREIAEEIEHLEWVANSNDTLGRIYCDMLHVDRARRHLERSLELATKLGSSIHRRRSSAHLANVYVVLGDPASALAVLETVLSTDTSVQSNGDRACWAVRAMAATADGDPARAVWILEKLRETTLNATASRIVPRHALLKGEALMALGSYPEAEAALLAARCAASELGYRPVLWRAWLALGTLYTAWDRKPDADRCFTEGRAVVTALARPITDATVRDGFLQAALGRFPEPRRLTALRAAKQEYGGLTGRQRDIAMLIAHGYTNAQIAGEMSISKRTVEGHVSGIMTTLNFSSRVQIATWAVNHGLVHLP